MKDDPRIVVHQRQTVHLPRDPESRLFTRTISAVVDEAADSAGLAEGYPGQAAWPIGTALPSTVSSIPTWPGTLQDARRPARRPGGSWRERKPRHRQSGENPLSKAMASLSWGSALACHGPMVVTLLARYRPACFTFGFSTLPGREPLCVSIERLQWQWQHVVARWMLVETSAIHDDAVHPHPHGEGRQF